MIDFKNSLKLIYFLILKINANDGYSVFHFLDNRLISQIYYHIHESEFHIPSIFPFI
jgi:hypothetical protein